MPVNATGKPVNSFDVDMSELGGRGGSACLGCGDNCYLSHSIVVASFIKPRKFAASLS